MKSGSVLFFQIMGWVAVGVALATWIARVVELDEYDFERIDRILLILVLPLLLIVGMAVCAPLATSKRSNAARWTFFGLALVLLLSSVLLMFGPMGPHYDIAAMLTFVEWAALISALVSALLPGVNAWVSRHPYAAHGAYAPAPAGGYPQASQFAPQPYPYAAPPQSTPAHAAGAATRPCPHCAEPIRLEASKCRFCGSEVAPAR